MTEAKYDVVVPGAGSGGYTTTLRAVQLGMKVILVEDDKVDGTCLHRGCIPIKAYLHVAETADAVRESEALRIFSGSQGIDMTKAGAYRNSVITKLYRGLQGLLSSRKVEITPGWGRLVSESSVEIDERVLTGRNVVLVTGFYSRPLPGLGISGRVISSDQALQVDWVPCSAVILGGGMIGLEFTSVWHSFGAEVAIIEALPHLTDNEDEMVSRQLGRTCRKRDITLHASTRFSGAIQDENGVHASTETGKTFDTDILLIAVDRGPVTQGPGYEGTGIRMDHDFVLVDECLHTDIGSTRAVGDTVSDLQLAHRGFLQGILVAEDIAGLNPAVIDEFGIPRATLYEPEIASVGLTERAAREKYGGVIRMVEYNLVGNGRLSILGTTGSIKFVSIENGPIMDFHKIGSHIGEQIGGGEPTVNWETYPSDAALLIHAHPSQNEPIDEIAMVLIGKPLHTRN